MKSMTGFGRAEGFRNDLNCGLKVEISSINKKQFEIKFAMPKELASLEMDLRSQLSEKLVRGSVTLRIEINASPVSDSGNVDFSKAAAILIAARKFQKENNLPGEITIADILAIPDAATVRTADFSGEETLAFLKQTVSEAVVRLIDLRSEEGANLEADILSRLATMEQTVNEIEPLAKLLPEIMTQKLCKKMKELELISDDNDDRILREAVIYGDKLDVSEEITRLHSHFDNFRKIASDRENAVGRSLDFLVQEIFRECNTLGNKAASVEISPKIVQLKTELEKIREQVQNIE